MTTHLPGLIQEHRHRKHWVHKTQDEDKKKTILTLTETKKMRHTDPIKNESELRCSGRTAVPASYKPFYGTKLLLL